MIHPCFNMDPSPDGPCLTSLPNVPLLQILSYLDYKDLISCSFACQSLRTLTRDDKYWKYQCKKYWLLDKCPAESSWRELFEHSYRDRGRYISVYPKIRRAWDQIESVVKTHCTPIYESLRDGLSEAQLDHIENQLKVELPLSLRCAYRIHDGQELEISPGLMGTVTIHTHFRSEKLLSLLLSIRPVEDSGNVIILTYSGISHVAQMIALSEEGGYNKEQIFYNCPSSEFEEKDNFISGTSFLEWFTSYAQHLADDAYPIRDSHIYKFYKDLTCCEVTNFIKVQVQTCFMPELSSVDPPHFFHTYHITMSMAADAPVSKSCQLQTRHWYIMDEEERLDEVNGPGVVGEFPIMRPGASFSWTSCTTFTTTYGNMRGHFIMRNLQTGEEVEVACPVFHMKCLPYQTHADRKERALAHKKDL